MKKSLETEKSRLTSEEEQGLIIRAKAGDREAFGRLIEDNIQRIYSLAFSLSQNKYDAEEITQEVFLKAVRNIRAFRAESRVGTWLYRITVNTFLNMKRKRVFLPFKDSEVNPNHYGIQGSSNDGSDDDLTASINRSIGNLSARERSVFILRHYENISTKGYLYDVGNIPQDCPDAPLQGGEQIEKRTLRTPRILESKQEKTMTTCKKIKKLIPLSFYNELDEKETEILRRHIKDCKNCEDEYEKSLSLLGIIPKEHSSLLNKKEQAKLEDKIKTRIYQGKDSSIVNKQALSPAYALLMLVLLITALLALKNPAPDSQDETDTFNIHSKLLPYPDAILDERNDFYSARNISSKDHSVKESAINTMDIISSLESIIYNDENFEVRKSAVIALAQIGTESAVRSIMAISRNHRDPKIRIEAIRCLAGISKGNYERRHLLQI